MYLQAKAETPKHSAVANNGEKDAVVNGEEDVVVNSPRVAVTSPFHQKSATEAVPRQAGKKKTAARNLRRGKQRRAAADKKYDLNTGECRHFVIWNRFTNWPSVYEGSLQCNALIVRHPVVMPSCCCLLHVWPGLA